jgi:hypothetical protein
MQQQNKNTNENENANDTKSNTKNQVFHIKIEDPIPNAPLLHQEASKLMPQGGTLDPQFDYSICYIWKYTTSQ